MSSPVLTSTFPAPHAEAVPHLGGGPRRADWLREPLFHFLILGGLLFLVDHILVGRADDPRKIVVGADVNREAVETFVASRGRDPNKEELEALHRVWLDNEVLYREGLAMQVDKGDPAIRERVIFKALSVIDSNVKLPPVDDQALRAWFEGHRGKYDEPARFDFQEAVPSGESNEAAVRSFVETLNSAPGGDTGAALRVFKGRPRSNLVQSYGPDFAQAVEQAPVDKWLALKSREGWRAIRVGSVIPSKPAVFEARRGIVLQDWKDSLAAEQRTAAVRALTGKYQVTYEPVQAHEGAE